MSDVSDVFHLLCRLTADCPIQEHILSRSLSTDMSVDSRFQDRWPSGRKWRALASRLNFISQILISGLVRKQSVLVPWRAVVFEKLSDHIWRHWCQKQVFTLVSVIVKHFWLLMQWKKIPGVLLSGCPAVREKSGKFQTWQKSGKSQGILLKVREKMNIGKVREFAFSAI